LSDIIEIGRRLIECERLCKAEGRWLQWINDEFAWSRQTADRFIDVAKASLKVPNLDTLNIPVSGLYLLASLDQSGNFPTLGNFILSRNMARRNLTKGQLAIVAAKVFPERRSAGRKGKNASKNEAFPMVHEGALSG
jgi:hypothetical protein